MRRFWTEEEKQIFVDFYKIISIQDLANILDRTISSLRSYANACNKVQKRNNKLKRFFSKVLLSNNKYDNTFCWEWTGGLTHDGYGRFKDKTTKVAHKWYYEYMIQKIPNGLTLDHLCRNRKCVNLKHLQIVTMRENILRGVGLAAKNNKKTHCPKGHEYNKENTYFISGKRVCGICRRIRYKMEKR